MFGSKQHKGPDLLSNDQVNAEDPYCGSWIAVATILSCGLGGVDFEGSFQNVRCCRVDIYSGLRICYCKDYCSSDKANSSFVNSICCCPLSMVGYCLSGCCLCDIYTRYAKCVHNQLGVRFPGQPLQRQRFCSTCLADTCSCPMPLLAGILCFSCGECETELKEVENMTKKKEQKISSERKKKKKKKAGMGALPATKNPLASASDA